MTAWMMANLLGGLWLSMKYAIMGKTMKALSMRTKGRRKLSKGHLHGTA